MIVIKRGLALEKQFKTLFIFAFNYYKDVLNKSSKHRKVNLG